MPQQEPKKPVTPKQPDAAVPERLPEHVPEITPEVTPTNQRVSSGHLKGGR